MIRMQDGCSPKALAISLVKRELDTEDLWERKWQIIRADAGPVNVAR